MIRLAIVGTREYSNYEEFEKIVDQHIGDIGRPAFIVSGGARGIDSLAERYAKEHKINTEIYHPDWKRHGKAAALIRNTDIISNATHVLALPGPSSRGTYDAIRKAIDRGKILKIVEVS